MIKVMIVDDDPLVRLGLSDLVDHADGMTVVAQAEDGVQAVQFATEIPVEVALVDIRMPRMDGVATISALRALPRGPRSIALTTFDVDEYVYDALRAGADAFLLKDTDPNEIMRAIRLVKDGSAILHPVAARRLIDALHRSAPADSAQARRRIESLTPREREVLALLARGASNARIGGMLGMRESTVKAHVSRILSALDAANRVQAAMTARDGGLR